ncbi:MAG: tRNA 2-thiouridine(34) synthase MnmA [Granulosicoccaceae bacterium]
MSQLNNKHIVIGMSGGVDSSVAAHLLVQQGHQVVGVFMQNWEDEEGDCTARQDYRDASAVCAQLGIELHAVNFAAEYWDRVFSHFLSEYQAGRTPNPDILCNREIKFKAFLDYARELGADAIATGHYARHGTASGQAALLRGVDESKDQSYFLHALNQEQLSPSLFPLGELEKTHVREIARKANLHVAGKKDSTGICFIGERHFNEFLSTYLPAQSGEIVGPDNELLGHHGGLMYYTLGQRRGLGVGGTQNHGEDAWFVAHKSLSDNRLHVVQGHDNPALFKQSFKVEDINWCRVTPDAATLRCTAKIRYRQTDMPCTLTFGSDAHSAKVVFDQATRAVTPGQSAVFYSGEECLGGGVICDFNATEN